MLNQDPKELITFIEDAIKKENEELDNYKAVTRINTIMSKGLDLTIAMKTMLHYFELHELQTIKRIKHLEKTLKLANDEINQQISRN